MTFAVVVSVALSLALFGGSLLMSDQVNTMKGYWYDKVNVSIFLCNKSDAESDPNCAKGAVTDDQKKQIQADLGKMSVVEKVTYESQDEAYKHYKERSRSGGDVRPVGPVVGTGRVAAGIGSYVQMQRSEGKFTTRLNGAQPILSTGGRCSAGFNVTNGTTDFILTAGHCGPAKTIWFDEGQGNNQQVGTTIDTQFPGSDFSLIQYANGKAGDNADVVAIGNGQGVRITGSADPTVGQKVFRSGSTSGLHDGTVTALNATVNYPEGTVTGLIQTNVCAEPGDSGGPLFSEGIALGVTSGGSGDCTVGGVTFFQPVTRAMAALNVQLIVSKQAAAGAQSGAPTPSTSATHSAIAPSAASPGSAAPVGTSDGTGLIARLTDTRNVGPGLLVVGGSLVALVATRFIRAEQDRKAYQRYYSATWG
ncbi:permease-like cell division protein FtsX [Streptomyces sp. NPDC005921]